MAQNGITTKDQNDALPLPDLNSPHKYTEPGYDREGSKPRSWASDENKDGRHTNVFMRSVGRVQNKVTEIWERNDKVIITVIKIIILLGYVAYFGYAMYYERLENEASIRLLWCTLVVVFFWLMHLLRVHCGRRLRETLSGVGQMMVRRNELLSWLVVLLVFAVFLVFVLVDVFHGDGTVYNLVSVAGIITYIILMFLFSHSPAQVRWRPVAWGLGLQCIFALIILRWSAGFQAFQWLGNRITEFLLHSDAGAIFVFGESYMDHFFAFKVLPVVVFFSSVVSVLYYLGWMHILIDKIAWVMQNTMGTTAAESLNAAGNIFVGQTEAPLLIQPLISGMTRSELHAVMTGGFATIAGAVMAAYILFGVPASHLLAASVMSAPAALAVAKLFYPETEEPRTKEEALAVASSRKGEDRNLIDAASSGASRSLALVGNIAVNLIAFVSLLHFLNATLTWLGNRVGVEELTFEYICSYVLFPFAMVMGVDIEDCRHVAELIGIKSFINEFVAYDRLTVYIHNKESLMSHIESGGEWYEDGSDIILQGTNTTLINGILTERSEVIATYALCGFSNFSSIGIMLGGLTPMAPERRQDLSAVALRAMIAGNVACFLTACIAGSLFQETAPNLLQVNSTYI